MPSSHQNECLKEITDPIVKAKWESVLKAKAIEKPHLLTEAFFPVLLTLDPAYLDQNGLEAFNDYCDNISLSKPEDLSILLELLNKLMAEARIKHTDNQTYIEYVNSALVFDGFDLNIIRYGLLIQTMQRIKELTLPESIFVTEYLFLSALPEEWFYEQKISFVMCIYPNLNIDYFSSVDYGEILASFPIDFLAIKGNLDSIHQLIALSIKKETTDILQWNEVKEYIEYVLRKYRAENLDTDFLSKRIKNRILMLQKLSKKWLDPVRGKLIEEIEEEIESLDIEDIALYMQDLNVILQNLEYPASFYRDLNKNWHTLEGAQVIIKLSKQYWTPIGFKFLNKYDVKMIAECIDLLNKITPSALSPLLEQTKEINKTKLIEYAEKIIALDLVMDQLKKENEIHEGKDRITLRQANVIKLVEEECPISLVPLISKEEPDAVIYIPNAKPLTFEQLKKISLVEHEKHKQFYAANTLKVGIRLDFGKLTRDNIKILDENNLDLDFLNEKLGLKPASKKPEAVVHQAIISWAEKLRESNLDKIPVSFLTLDMIRLLYYLTHHMEQVNDYLKETSISSSVLYQTMVRTLADFICVNVGTLNFKEKNKNILSCNDVVVEILKRYQVVENFNRIVEMLGSAVTHEVIQILWRESKETFYYLYHLYDGAYENNRYLISVEVLVAMRTLIRAELIDEFKLDESLAKKSLEKIHTANAKVLTPFKEKLETYKAKRFMVDEQGKIVKPFLSLTKNQRLSAYLALERACQTGNAVRVMRVIEKCSADIGLDEKKHYLEGLQQCSIEFLENIHDELYEKAISPVFRGCLEDENLLALCLMDDIFYAALAEKNMQVIIKKYPVIFMTVMEKYRRSGLTDKHRQACEVAKEAQLLEKFKKITKPSGLYQMQSIDIYAGIDYLHQQKQQRLHQSMLFLPLLKLDQAKETISEIAATNKDKLCGGVLHVNGNHYVTIFIYNQQMIIIDPQFSSDEKTNTLNEIKALFSGFKSVPAEFIIQQINDSDCGYNCLSNLEAALFDQAINVEDNKLVLHVDKILNVKNNINDPLKFQELSSEKRQQWDERLFALNECNAVYIDDSTASLGSYSLQKNQELQQLKSKAQNFLNEMIAYFDSKCCAKKKNPVDFVDDFILEDDICRAYFDTLKLINKLKTDNVFFEAIDFDEVTPKKLLLAHIEALKDDQKQLIRRPKVSAKQSGFCYPNFIEITDLDQFTEQAILSLNKLLNYFPQLVVTPKNTLSVFWSKFHKPLDEKIHSFNQEYVACINKLGAQTDIVSAQNCLFEIAIKLQKKLSKSANFFGRYPNDPAALHHFIRALLAELVGIPEQDIQEYNKPHSFLVLPASIEFGAIKISGYEVLENRIGDRLLVWEQTLKNMAKPTVNRLSRKSFVGN